MANFDTVEFGDSSYTIRDGKIRQIFVPADTFHSLFDALCSGSEDVEETVRRIAESGHSIQKMREQCLDEIARGSFSWARILSTIRQNFVDAHGTYGEEFYKKHRKNLGVSRAVYRVLFKTAWMSCGLEDPDQFKRMCGKDLVKICRSKIRKATRIRDLEITYNPKIDRLYEGYWLKCMDSEFAAAKREVNG